MNLRSAVAAAAVLLLSSASAQAQFFLDLSSVTPGGNGTGAFAGTLGGVGVTGSITSGPAATFQFSATGAGFENSTIDNTSPQYSYGSVYSPTEATTDRVGYAYFGGETGIARITINFAQPVTNPVFHVANLDSMQYDFSANSVALSLLNGNGDGEDGLRVNTTTLVVSDSSPATLVGQAPSENPLLTGNRSAYGSILLSGTFSTLLIDVNRNPNLPNLDGDGGSFTLSAIPEPSTGLMALGAIAGLAIVARRRKAKQ